ncbi:GGDEF domain-containing protein [Paenibacillus alkaliterrae]|uniref:diguanylate cyclase domain-containing protein n=1 Tax=Paenibacillus alkaliterrae TaxID=320909 RepID=UPI001F35E367|nr:GGDEF domain-containing protein [Paenibacillus alkaliterrae]MCF2938333.1 GGDEF domain-containing protein [Paenibacillus alkaliterrae]
MKVKDFMASPVYTVSSERSVQYVSDLMNELKVGSLVVMDYGMTVGIITSRDIRSSHPNRIVADAMTPIPISTSPDQFAWDALETMEQHRIERLLVVQEEQVLGIVTREALHIKLSQILDPLTGLYRAPYIQQIGEHFLNHRQYFELLFIDLNNFGKINKEYGHPMGDDILIEYSNRLRALTNERDYVCRYAGDEFVVITRSMENDAMRLADSLSQLTVLHNINMSASVGLANSRLVPDFFALSFRDLISKASLLSTSLKQSSAS